MEYLYGLLFGTEPDTTDVDARHALHAKLDALPDRDAQIALTADELRLLKAEMRGTPPKRQHGGGDELFVRMRSDLEEDHDAKTADAVVDAYGASPLKPNPLAKRRPSPDLLQLRKAVQDAGPLHDLISERQLSSSVPKERRRTLETALSCVGEWGFDVWAVADAFQGDTLLAARAIVDAVVFEARGFRAASTSHLLRQVVAKMLASYQDVPYHNCLHGADVLQAMHALLNLSPSFDDALDDDVVLVTLLACLSHDVGHPGLTNNFLVETGHELAIRYNDASPLENMHAAVALNLAKPYLRTRPPEEQKGARALWIGLLLATMKEHSHQIYELERALSKATERGSTYEACAPAHHVPCLKIFIHACDVSNPAKPWAVYRRWTSLVMEEFWRQAELERERGLPLTVPRRGATDLAKFQLGFISFVRPLFAAADRIAGVEMGLPLRHIDATARRWQEEPSRVEEGTRE